MRPAAITFDTGAIIASREAKAPCREGLRAREGAWTHRGDANVTIVEWWRGRTDWREAILAGLLVESVSDETAKLAGLTLGKVRGATAVDAIVAAFAAERTGIVYTSDVEDLQALGGFFRGLRVFAI